MALPSQPLGSRFSVAPSGLRVQPLGVGHQHQPLGQFTPHTRPTFSKHSNDAIASPANPANAKAIISPRSLTPCLGQVIQAQLQKHPLIQPYFPSASQVPPRQKQSNVRFFRPSDFPYPQAVPIQRLDLSPEGLELLNRQLPIDDFSGEESNSTPIDQATQSSFWDADAGSESGPAVMSDDASGVVQRFPALPQEPSPDALVNPASDGPGDPFEPTPEPDNTYQPPGQEARKPTRQTPSIDYPTDISPDRQSLENQINPLITNDGDMGDTPDLSLKPQTATVDDVSLLNQPSVDQVEPQPLGAQTLDQQGSDIQRSPTPNTVTPNTVTPNTADVDSSADNVQDGGNAESRDGEVTIDESVQSPPIQHNDVASQVLPLQPASDLQRLSDPSTQPATPNLAAVDAVADDGQELVVDSRNSALQARSPDRPTLDEATIRARLASPDIESPPSLTQEGAISDAESSSTDASADAHPFPPDGTDHGLLTEDHETDNPSSTLAASPVSLDVPSLELSPQDQWQDHDGPPDGPMIETNDGTARQLTDTNHLAVTDTPVDLVSEEQVTDSSLPSALNRAQLQPSDQSLPGVEDRSAVTEAMGGDRLPPFKLENPSPEAFGTDVDGFPLPQESPPAASDFPPPPLQRHPQTQPSKTQQQQTPQEQEHPHTLPSRSSLPHPVTDESSATIFRKPLGQWDVLREWREMLTGQNPDSQAEPDNLDASDTDSPKDTPPQESADLSFEVFSDSPFATEFGVDVPFFNPATPDEPDPSELETEGSGTGESDTGELDSNENQELATEQPKSPFDKFTSDVTQAVDDVDNGIQSINDKVSDLPKELKKWSSIEDMLAQSSIPSQEEWEKQFSLSTPGQSPRQPHGARDSAESAKASKQEHPLSKLKRQLDPSAFIDKLEAEIDPDRLADELEPDLSLDDLSLDVSRDMEEITDTIQLKNPLTMLTQLVDGKPDEETLDALAHVLYHMMRDRLLQSQERHHGTSRQPSAWLSLSHSSSSPSSGDSFLSGQMLNSLMNAFKPNNRASPTSGLAGNPYPTTAKVDSLVQTVYFHLSDRLRRDRERHG